MEGEINNFILVWTTAITSLCYCHTVAKFFPASSSGTTTTIARPLAIFPIICLFLVLPLNLTSIHLGGSSSFFISWLATFKLLLFAFNKGPLSSDPPIPLSRFIPLACFPIKIQQNSQQPNPQKSPLNYVVKIIIFAILVRVYDYKNSVHQKVIWFCYCLHIYIVLEMLLVLTAALAKALVKVDLEPQFDEPYLTTSLQDFWGRRWNLMVSNILQPTVYQPIRSISARVVTRKWAPIPAVLATFLVSGLMHELVFYNIGRLRPSGEATSFFLLHGVSLSVEIVVKKMLDGRFCLPGIISGPLTMGYVVLTCFWLFFPPFLRGNSELKACTEVFALVEFVKSHRLVSPRDLSCPYL